MKRITILVALTVFCLPQLLSAAESAAPAPRPEQTTNCTTDSENEWVELGEIIMQPGDKRAILYVRVVGHISFYRVKIDGSFYAVTKNPKYNPAAQYKNFDTRATHMAKDYYFDIPN